MKGSSELQLFPCISHSMFVILSQGLGRDGFTGILCLPNESAINGLLGLYREDGNGL